MNPRARKKEPPDPLFSIFALPIPSSSIVDLAIYLFDYRLPCPVISFPCLFSVLPCTLHLCPVRSDPPQSRLLGFRARVVDSGAGRRRQRFEGVVGLVVREQRLVAVVVQIGAIVWSDVQQFARLPIGSLRYVLISLSIVYCSNGLPRVLLSTDFRSIKTGSCVSWHGLFRISWPRSSLDSSWRFEMIEPISAVNCFSSLLTSNRKLSRLMVRLLGPIVFGFVPIQSHLLGAVGWYLISSHFDARTQNCLLGWTCILYLRLLLCSLILLVYPGTSAIALLPRICGLSHYCCPAYCVSCSVASALTMKWMPLFWSTSHFCCPFLGLPSSVPLAQAISLTWWACVDRKVLLYPSFHRPCSQCLVHLIQWPLLPPSLGELNISFMMRLLMHFSEAGRELFLNWVILLLLLSLCMGCQVCCYSMLLYNGLPCCFDSGYGRSLSCITLCFALHLIMVVSCSGIGKGVIWGSYLLLVNLILTCHCALVLLANNCPLTDCGPCLLHCISLILRETVCDWLWWEGLCLSHPCSQLPCMSPYLIFDPNQNAMMFRIPDGMVANLHGGWCYFFLMRFFSSPFATWVALFVNWGLPLCWLSLLLGRLAAPKHEPLWSCFCWRLAVTQRVRDEEKGKNPSVYEDFLSETALAIAPVLAFSRDICLLFQWLATGTWHPYDWKTRWVASRMADCYRVFGATAHSIVSSTSSLCCSVDMYCPCTLLFSFSFRLESPDMFVGRFQCNNGIVVRSIFGCCIPCNANIFRDLEQHLCVLGMYLLVLGPCLMALGQHRIMLGIACRGPGLCSTALAWHRTRAWMFIIVVRLSCLFFLSSFLTICAFMDRALRHLLGRSDCLDLSKTIKRPFAVLFDHLCSILWKSSLVCWLFWSLKRLMLLASAAYWFYLKNYSP